MADHSAWKGTLGGTLTVMLANITSREVTHTAILAAIGAIVSFGVSMLLRKIAASVKQRQRVGKPGG
jgi:hypothetical protein